MKPEAPLEKMLDKAFAKEFGEIKSQQDKAQFKGTNISYHQDRVDKQAALRCPSCNNEVFERVMDTKVVDQAYYEDGKLVNKEKSFEVHESFLRCARCAYDFSSHDELRTEIEELFL